MPIDNADLFLNVGAQRIFINPGSITVKMTRKIREAATKVKSKHSPLNKLPRKPNETGEDWTERWIEYIGKTNIKRPEESDEDYKLRILNPTSIEDDLDYLADMLIEIANLFDGQGSKITKTYTDENNMVIEGSFEHIVLEEACEFLVKILKKAKYPTLEFELNR